MISLDGRALALMVPPRRLERSSSGRVAGGLRFGARRIFVSQLVAHLISGRCTIVQGLRGCCRAPDGFQGQERPESLTIALPDLLAQSWRREKADASTGWEPWMADVILRVAEFWKKRVKRSARGPERGLPASFARGPHISFAVIDEGDGRAAQSHAPLHGFVESLGRL